MVVNTTLIFNNLLINSTLINEQEKIIFGFIWWKLLLLLLLGFLTTLVLCCVIIFTIIKTRKASSSTLYTTAADEMPTNILIQPRSNRHKSPSMKVKLLGKRDIRSTVQDQHYPISNKKRSYWEHSMDYTNPYNPYSKRRSYFTESNYSA